MTNEDQDVPSRFYLFDKVDNESARDIVEWIMDANMMEVPHEFLTLVINSDGGELSSAFAIIDTMTNSNIPVRTIGMGEVLSSAFMIFMAGQKGKRMLMPNTCIMTHRFSAGSEGKFHDLEAAAKDFKQTHERMINHYLVHTGLTKPKVMKKLLPHEDVYLTPQDAVELNCADTVG